MKKLALTTALTATMALAGAMPAFAQYPTSPVQFVVPFPPGDFEDILTRMIADNMQEKTGVSVSVVNKPGGGDGPFPGALEVLAAPNDGTVIGSFVGVVPIVGPLIDIGIEMDSFVQLPLLQRRKRWSLNLRMMLHSICWIATHCQQEMQTSSTQLWP